MNAHERLETDLPRRRHPGAGLAPRGARPGPGRGGVPQRHRTRCSPCSTAARTRAARCSQGIVFGTSVACPLHNWTIGLCTRPGRARPTKAARRASRSRWTTARCSWTTAELASHATDLTRPVAGPGAPHGLRLTPTARTAAMTETRSTCPYCGVGCGVIIESRRRRRSPACAATRTTRPTSGGCAPRAPRLHLTASAAITRQTRLLQPMQRAAARRSAAAPSAGTRALDLAAEPLCRHHRSSTAPTPWASTSRASC